MADETVVAAGTADASGGGAATEVIDAPVVDTTTPIVEADKTVVTEPEIDFDGLDESKPEVKEEPKPGEEPELKDFAGTVSARIRNLVKMEPLLGQAFAKNPQVKNHIEGVMRRDMAYRDAFPTVAEARALREALPNGQADLQVLLDDVKDLETLDTQFDQRDRDGKYPGHSQMVKDFFSRDKTAAVAFLKQMPKEWSELDRGSYNEVMSEVVAATFQAPRAVEVLDNLFEFAKSKDDPELTKHLNKLFGWMESFGNKKAKSTPEQERLDRERQAFDQRVADGKQATFQTFRKDYLQQAQRLQLDVIEKHPAIMKLNAITTIDKSRKDAIKKMIWEKTVNFLSKSPSYMRKLRPIHASGNLNESLVITRAAWGQQWLINKMVRDVMQKETPNLVAGNREAAARRAGGRTTTTTTSAAVKRDPPKTNRQVNGQWYRPNGTKFTTSEVLAGKHLA